MPTYSGSPGSSVLDSVVGDSDQSPFVVTSGARTSAEHWGESIGCNSFIFTSRQTDFIRLSTCRSLTQSQRNYTFGELIAFFKVFITRNTYVVNSQPFKTQN